MASSYHKRMRRLLAVLAVVAALAGAQMTKTAEELASYIRTAIANHYKDGDVAASIEHMRLSTRLDPKVVTDLQRLGAGAKTVAILTRLSQSTAALPTPTAKPEAPPAPPPAADEIRRIVDTTRENALTYTQSLPNYICRQVTRRRVDPNSSGTWRDVDQIVEEL